MSQLIKVLSIDGGGVRGIIPAMIVAEIEKRTGQPACELFDLVVGTSTGGILALGLTLPDPDDSNQPHYTAEEIADLYRNRGKDVFTGGSILRSLIDERYPSTGIESVLEDYFGDIRLGEALTDVMITGYEIQRRRPHLFKSNKARSDDPTERQQHNFPMRKIARATTAAPTLFEVARLDFEGEDGNYLALIDGGVFANNPALEGYVEAFKNNRDADILVISLGTGQINVPLSYDQVKDWGLVHWARGLLIDLILDGVGRDVGYLMNKLLPEKRFFRFQFDMDKVSPIDDASDKNIAALEKIARQLITEHAEDLDYLAQILPKKETDS